MAYDVLEFCVFQLGRYPPISAVFMQSVFQCAFVFSQYSTPIRKSLYRNNQNVMAYLSTTIFLFSIVLGKVTWVNSHTYQSTVSYWSMCIVPVCDKCFHTLWFLCVLSVWAFCKQLEVTTRDVLQAIELTKNLGHHISISVFGAQRFADHVVFVFYFRMKFGAGYNNLLYIFTFNRWTDTSPAHVFDITKFNWRNYESRFGHMFNLW